MIFSFISLIQKHRACNCKVDKQGNCVDDRGDEGACHNCGVESDALCRDGKGTADDFCHYDGRNERQRYDEICGKGNFVMENKIIHENYFYKVTNRKHRAAKDRNSRFLPDYRPDIAVFDLAHGKSADDRNG